MLSVLVITNQFAPVNNCGAIPNTKLIKYLAREDVEITLITNEIDPHDEVDENLIPKEIEQIHVMRIGQSKLYHALIGKTREKITDNGVKLKMKAETRPFRAKIVSSIKNTFFFLRRQDWILSAKKSISKQLGGKHFDVVYSTYPNYEAHCLARSLYQSGIADRWVADFRDPMGYVIHDKYHYEKSMRQQHQIEKAADYITVVSEGALEKFLEADQKQNKICVLPNGFDPDDFQIEKLTSGNTQKMLRFFYAGTLYFGKRDLSVLFKALSELSKAGEIDLANVRVEYAGNEWPVMLSFAQQYGLEEICVNYGYITRSRVMELMREIDCSIVCTYNTNQDQGVVTGKIFELLLVEKPILAVIVGNLPDSELGRIVRECDAGLVYEEANNAVDYPALKQWLKDCYCQKTSTGNLPLEINTDARDQYSYLNIAKRLYDIFVQLTEDKHHS